MSDLLNRLSDNNEIERLRREKAEEEWRSAVDRLIDKAQKEGVFDNLPGKGKPLNLKKNPYASDQSLAYDLLENNNYTLPWIADRKELLAQVAAFRQDLEQEWWRQRARRQGTPDPARFAALQQAWRAQLQEVDARIRELNQAIADVNLLVPIARLEILKLNLANELARIGAEAD